MKQVIFDFDGTLVDSQQVFISAYNQLASRHGFGTIDSGNLEHLRQLSVTERFRYLHVPFYRVPFLTAGFLRLYRQSMEQLTLFPGIRELLAELEEKGFSVAIVSSNSTGNIRQYLESQNIYQVKTVYSSSNIFGKEKVIRRFLKDRGLKKDEVIYVGDEVRDVVAAKKSGVKVIGVPWGYDREEMISAARPDFMVEKAADIVDLLMSSDPESSAGR